MNEVVEGNSQDDQNAFEFEVEWVSPACGFFRRHWWSAWSEDPRWVGRYTSPLQFRVCAKCNAIKARSVIR